MKHIVKVIPKEEILANRSNAYEFIDMETLEEAANEYSKKKYSIDYGYCEEDYYISFLSFRAGAKWQQQNSYSEEDMQEYAKFCIRCYDKGLPCIIAKDWFEQFKNK
jgi:hypothetical protein